MSDSIGAIVVGLGTHGRNAAKWAEEAGARIVGAVDPASAGKSLAAVAGEPLSPDVIIAPSFGSLDERSIREAEVVILAALLPPEALVDLAVSILEQGLNVITIVEFLFDAETLPGGMRERIEAAALQNNLSFVATGAQDIVWSGVVLQLTGAVRHLRSVNIVQKLGVDGYPEKFLREDCLVAATDQDFPAIAAGIKEHPSVLGAILPVMAREMGLVPLEPRRTVSRVTLDQPLPSATFGRDLAAGESIGIRDRVEVDTEEGIALTAELVTTAHQPGEHDVFEVVLDAEPRIEMNHTMIPGPLNVDATVVNRLADVVAARPGIVPTAELPRPAYRHLVRKY